MSSILLEKNGKQSCSKHTKHMDIHFFYITENIQNKTLLVEHCPSKDMLADFFTKPLQRALLVKLQNVIMGAEYGDPVCHTHRCVVDEDDGSHMNNEYGSQHSELTWK